MANDIRNILTISGNQKLIDEMLKAIQVDAFGRGSIDFNKVLPIPKELDIPEVRILVRALLLLRTSLIRYQTRI